MIISPSRKFIFVHVHKTGGSSLKFALDPFLAWNDLILGTTDRGQALNGPFLARYGLGKHSAVHEIEKVCGAELLRRYFTFALVRHPLERACSLYNFTGSLVTKWSRREGIAIRDIVGYLENNPDKLMGAPFLQWQAPRAFCTTNSFSEFLHSGELREETAWQTQASRLKSTDGADCCNAFRLEDRATWLSDLCRRLEISFELPHRNRSEERLITQDGVSPQDRRFIETVYADDYAAFAY